MFLAAANFDTFGAIFLRLAILVILLLITIGFVRVLIELRIEEQRKRKLAITRNICSLNPAAFEAYIAILFEKSGYRVKQVGGSGDRGIDLVVTRHGRTSVVQCKRYEENIGPSTVRELIGAMTNERENSGFLVTTSGFTAGAKREARRAPYRLELVDGARLVLWAKRHGLPGELMGYG